MSAQIYEGDSYGGVFIPPTERDQMIRVVVDGIYRLFEMSENQDDRANSHEILTYAVVLADMQARRRL